MSTQRASAPRGTRQRMHDTIDKSLGALNACTTS